MLRRLNSIAMRTSRRNRHDDDVVSTEATASTTDNGTSDGVTPSTRYSNSSNAEIRRAPASGGSPESSEFSTPGWRRGSTGHQRGNHPADDAHDGAGGVRSAAVSTGQGERYVRGRINRSGPQKPRVGHVPVICDHLSVWVETQ